MNYTTHPDYQVQHESVFDAVCGYCKSIRRLTEQDKRIAELEAALQEIAKHRHLSFFSEIAWPDRKWASIPESFAWKDGHADGHFCCSKIAHKALGPKEE